MVIETTTSFCPITYLTAEHVNLPNYIYPWHYNSLRHAFKFIPLIYLTGASKQMRLGREGSVITESKSPNGDRIPGADGVGSVYYYQAGTNF